MAFKGHPENTDMRGAISLQVCRQLTKLGVQVYAYDMVVKHEDIKDKGNEPWQKVPLVESGLDGIIVMNNHKGHRALGLIRETKNIDRAFLFFDGWHQFEENEIATSTVSYHTLGYRSHVKQMNEARV